MEFETVLQSDLSKPVQVKQLTGNLFSGDNRGNKITVEVFDNGSPATLMGDVSGYVIRADGKTVVIADTQGTNYTEKDGNRVSVILPQSAYVVVGQVSIVIKVGTVTVGACTSYVYKSTTDQQIDPGSVVPDISTLMGIIEDCIGATEDAETATLAAQSVTAQATAKINEINSAIIATSSALGEDSPNLIELPDAVIDKTSSYNVKVITSTDGKVRVEGVKSTSGTGIIVLTSVFYVPAGDYYFGSRRGVLGGIYFQLRESSSATTPTDAGSIASETGFKKITIATGKYAFVRLALHGSDIYVGSTELYPELVPVNNSEVFTPGGLIANDPIARITNTNENYGFISLFTQKRIAVIGDSISSYNNQKYCGNYVYYYPSPLIPDVDSTEKTWWMRVANASGSVIAFNESEAGAYATNQRPDGRIDFYARVEALYARNVSPDLIFVALGTNDSVNSVAIGDYDFTSSIADLAEDTFRPAYTKGIKDLQYRFPNAEIVCLIFQMDDDYAESITHIAYRLGCKVINSKVYTTGSSVHPNEMGMRQIASTILLNAEKNAITMNWSSGASDLNDYKEPGMYLLPSRTDYSHLPSDVPHNPSQAMQLFVLGHPTEANYRIQRLYFTSGNTVAHYREYIRVLPQSTFGDWAKVYDLDEENSFQYSAIKFISTTTATDLNTLDECGISILPAALVKTDGFDPHLPEAIETETVAKHILVYRNLDSYYVIQRLFVTGNNSVSQYREFVRVRNTETNWNAWKEVYNEAELDKLIEAAKWEDNDILDYTTDTFSGTMGYTGTKLRFMSYNVAKYNNDTATYISDEKKFNIKKMIAETQPDFIGVQEDYRVDGSESGAETTSTRQIYAPIFPVGLGTTICTLKSKIAATTDYGIMYYNYNDTNARWLRAAIFTVDEKKVLVCSTHPVADYNSTGADSADSIAARNAQYTQLFKWVYGEVSLKDVNSANMITCNPDAWDYCIICGDMNTITADDRTNLKTLATARNFTMANGGWLGWLETARNKAGTALYSLDNVIVSSNVVITGIRSCKSLYPDLYSDHYPLVVDVVLKD